MEATHSARPEPIDYPTVVEREAAAMVLAVAEGSLSNPVPGCPAWSLADLVIHVGQVHRWASNIVETGKPGDLDTGPASRDLAGVYLAEGVAPLVKQLRVADLDEPCWNFTRQNETKAFWPRRQAIETATHRWDAQSALGPHATEPIDAALASDAIDEWLQAIVRRVVGRSKADLSAFIGDLHLHCADIHGEWTFEVVDGAVAVREGHAKAAAAVRGPASDLYLYLMNRVPVDRVERFGDTALIDRWLELVRF